MNKTVILLVTLFFHLPVDAGYVLSDVDKVGTSWDVDAACIYLQSGDVVKLDMSKRNDEVGLSLALTAKASGKRLKVYFDDAGPLMGGCDTGPTVKPHGIIQMQD